MYKKSHKFSRMFINCSKFPLWWNFYQSTFYSTIPPLVHNTLNKINNYFYGYMLLWLTGAVLRMALDLLQVESETPTSWLVPVSGFTAMCVGTFTQPNNNYVMKRISTFWKNNFLWECFGKIFSDVILKHHLWWSRKLSTSVVSM